MNCNFQLVTISCILPCIKGMKKTLEEVYKSLKTEQGRSFHNRIEYFFAIKLNHYETNILCQVSTLLDPRYKMKGFCNSENSAAAVDWLRTKVANAFLQEKVLCSVGEISKPSAHVSNSNILTFLDDDDENEPSNTTLTVSTHADAVILIDTYIKGKRENKDTTDVLKYWGMNSKVFEALIPFVMKFLAIPGSSVPCERLFSHAGYIVSDRRCSLSPQNVQMLTMLNLNFDLLKF